MPRTQPNDIGKQCRTCARPVYRCLNCNKEFFPLRQDALTCSPNCRAQRAYNKKSRLKTFADGGVDA
jgi:hypothetical protein